MVVITWLNAFVKLNELFTQNWLTLVSVNYASINLIFETMLYNFISENEQSLYSSTVKMTNKNIML